MLIDGYQKSLDRRKDNVEEWRPKRPALIWPDNPEMIINKENTSNWMTSLQQPGYSKK